MLLPLLFDFDCCRSRRRQGAPFPGRRYVADETGGQLPGLRATQRRPKTMRIRQVRKEMNVSKLPKNAAWHQVFCRRGLSEICQPVARDFSHCRSSALGDESMCFIIQSDQTGRTYVSLQVRKGLYNADDSSTFTSYLSI